MRQITGGDHAVLAKGSPPAQIPSSVEIKFDCLCDLLPIRLLPEAESFE